MVSLCNVITFISASQPFLQRHLKVRYSDFQPQTFRAGVLIIDIIYGLLDQIGSVVNETRVSNVPGIVIALILFIGLCVLYVISSMVVTAWNKAEKKKTVIFLQIVVGISVVFGCSSYFIGDNIKDYAINMDKSGEIVDQVNSIRPFCLIAAVILYQLIPFCVNKFVMLCFYEDKKEDNVNNVVGEEIKKPPPFYLIVEEGANAAVLTMTLDTWFTVTESFDICESPLMIRFTWSLWVIMITVYTVFVPLIMAARLYKSKKACCYHYVLGILAALFVSVVTILFLLVDNIHPLSCSTNDRNRGHIQIFRLVISVLSLITFTLTLVSYCIWYHYKEYKKCQTETHNEYSILQPS